MVTTAMLAVIAGRFSKVGYPLLVVIVVVYHLRSKQFLVLALDQMKI